MGQDPFPAEQPLLLARIYPGRLDLAQLKGEHIHPPLPFGTVRSQGGELLQKLLPLSVKALHAAEGLRTFFTAEGVKQKAVIIGPQKRLVLVLPVQVHQQPPQLFQKGDGCSPAVYPADAAPAAGHFPGNYERLIGRDARLFQERCHLRSSGGGADKYALNKGALFALADLPRVGALAQEQVDGPDDDRFARSRLPAENIEALSKFQGEIFDEGKLRHPDLRKHLFSPPSLLAPP